MNPGGRRLTGFAAVPQIEYEARIADHVAAEAGGGHGSAPEIKLDTPAKNHFILRIIVPDLF
jgi:hypothetical protein